MRRRAEWGPRLRTFELEEVLIFVPVIVPSYLVKSRNRTLPGSLSPISLLA